jgi:hypothetical protein
MRVQMRAILVGLTLWILADSSPAGTLDVQFTLSGQVSVSLGFNSTPGSTTGMARVVLTGVDSSGMITGPGATGTLRDVTVQTSLMPIGPFTFSQLAPATGPFDGAAVSIAPMTFTVRSLNGTSGAMADFSNQLAFAAQLASLGTPGAAQLMLNVTVGPDIVMTRFSLLGREVSRSFVPEPSQIGLLAMSLGLLAVCTRRGLKLRSTR